MADRPAAAGRRSPDDAEVCACAGVTRRRGPRLRLPRRGPRRPPAPPPAAAAAPPPSASCSPPRHPHPGRNSHHEPPPAARRLVVVGHGMVGHRFVQAAIERGLTETHDVVVVGEEPRPAYDRVALTSFFEVGADALSLLPDGAVRRPAGAARPRHRGRRGSTPRRGPCSLADGEVLALRRAGAGHRRRAVRAAGPRPRPAGLLRLPHHRGPRGDPRGRRAARPRRRRRSAAACSGSRPPTPCASSAWRPTSSRWRRG